MEEGTVILGPDALPFYALNVYNIQALFARQKLYPL